MANRSKRRRPLRTLLILAAAALLTALFVRWDNTALQVTRFDPVFAGLPAGFDGCRLVVLSDLHGGEFGRGNEELLAAVAETAPDYIFYLGDLEDQYRGPREGYAEEIAEIPGSHTIEEAYANHGEVRYALATRQDVLTGYYKLDFNIVYERKGVPEKAVLTTYIKVNGKEESGSIDEEEEEEKKSTPRIIVTGFETEPKEVFAGSTFMLTIHVKNTSSRTAVSNIEFDLKAAEEGEDDKTLYASFLPTSGSNTIYVPSIPSGGETQLQIEMSAMSTGKWWIRYSNL